MIDKFFIQTNETIWSFLREIGKSKEIFSSLSGMEIDGYTVYFYATKTEVVLLCVDYAFVEDGTKEYADKGVARFKPNSPIKYFRKVLPDGTVSKNEKEWRFSPVMELYDHACRMHEFFAISQQFDIVPAVHLILLTNSCIVNYPKVVNTWQQDLFGFSVLHNLSGMKFFGYDRFPFNNDTCIEGSEYWTKWQKYLKNRGHFDWANPLWDDCPRPSEKRYSWEPEKGHLISDEYENKDKNIVDSI